jgi:hypothetical protein
MHVLQQGRDLLACWFELEPRNPPSTLKLKQVRGAACQ